MLAKINQHYPFSFRVAADDPLVYSTVRKLTSPSDIKMGDTPSVLYLLRGDPERPETPHWGGQFVKTDHGPCYWTDRPSKENVETVNRWREQYLRDWQQRLVRTPAHE